MVITFYEHRRLFLSAGTQVTLGAMPVPAAARSPCGAAFGSAPWLCGGRPEPLSAGTGPQAACPAGERA
ncbi:hypothetical protein [Microbispora sp. NPDC049125]|uniref:hypothetical protein n=1 Tax=Microbispora sp. NPDC049125 TaxID=3154929 RepID=UPI003466360D